MFKTHSTNGYRIFLLSGYYNLKVKFLNIRAYILCFSKLANALCWILKFYFLRYNLMKISPFQIVTIKCLLVLFIVFTSQDLSHPTSSARMSWVLWTSFAGCKNFLFQIHLQFLSSWYFEHHLLCYLQFVFITLPNYYLQFTLSTLPTSGRVCVMHLH